MLLGRQLKLGLRKEKSCEAGDTFYVIRGYKYRIVSYGDIYEDGKIVESTSFMSKTKYIDK